MEETLTEGIRLNSLSKETKKYYDFTMKKLVKYEDKVKESDKAKYRETYKTLKEKTSKLKKIHDKAEKLESEFKNSDNKEDKLKAKKEYKKLGVDASEILKSSKKEYNKLKNILVASGLTAATVAGIFGLYNNYNDYMHSFTRAIENLTGNTRNERLIDRLGSSIAWRMYKDGLVEEKDPDNYFNY